MYQLLNSSVFEMCSRNQSLNLKFLRDDLKKNDCLEHPLLKMRDNIRLKMNGHPLLKMQDNIRLKPIRLPFLKNQLDPIHPKPP